MPTYQAIDDFISAGQDAPVIDVRSPVEFEQAHIPGAVNLPLFDDQQRAEVGTLYKKQGQVASINRALQLITPRMEDLATKAQEVAVAGKLRVHCWRGGMRSRSTAWLFEKVDLQPTVLQGGYKAFRRHVLDSFKKPLNLIVLSGLTGSGKTLQLQVLKSLGQQILDLEALANHRGSAFGGIGLGQQPTVEHFENELYEAINQLDHSRPIWVEDESRGIGSVQQPHHFFDQLRAAPAYFIQCDRKRRVELIMDEYGELNADELVAATHRIAKRLGGQNVKRAVAAIESGDVESGVELLLEYYDRLYLKNKSNMDRDSFVDVPVDDPVSVETGHKLIEIAARH